MQSTQPNHSSDLLLTPSYILTAALIFALYVGSAQVGLSMDAISGFATLVWPPTGISLAALLLLGSRYWPAVSLGALIANLNAGATLPVALGISLGNTLEALAGAYFLKNFTDFHQTLDRIKDIVLLVVFGAILSTSLSATIGVASLWLGELQTLENLGVTWRAWWAGDALGTIIIVPFLVVWARYSFKQKPDLWTWVEMALLTLSLMSVCFLLFNVSPRELGIPNPTLPYVLFPCMIWAGLRFGQIGNVTTVLAISIFSVWGTIHGIGPFTHGPLRENLFLLHGFLSIIAITGLTVAATVEERKSATEGRRLGEKTLRTTHDELRKKIQELAQSRDQLDIILKGISDGITVLDSRGNFIYANEIGANMCGFSSVDEFLKTPLSEVMKGVEIIDEEGNPFPQNKLPEKQALAGVESPPEVIVRYRFKKTGEERWSIIKSSPIFDEIRQVRMAVSIFKDFTDRKRAEDSLKYLDEASRVLASSLHYEQTFSQLAKLAVPRLADWCIIHTLENQYLNPIAIAHTDPNKIAWTHTLLQKFPIDLNSTTSAIAKVIRTGEHHLIPEFTEDILNSMTLNKDYRSILVELGLKSTMIVPLKMQNKTFGAVSFISTKSNYTEKDLAMVDELARRAGLAVENATLYKQAQEAIHARDEFLSIASHELKTPLTSLSLQIQMTKRNINPDQNQAPSPVKLAKIFDISDKQVNRLNNLVEDLLDVSRIQTGRFSFNFEEMNLSEVVNDMINRFLGQFAKAKCALETHIEENVIGRFDNTRIEQIVDNIFSNVIKYAPNTPIKISLSSSGGKAIFVVQDHGPGIPVDKQAKIFERFERATDSSGVSGLGLGLFIVKEIVKGHNGSISLESELHQGSTFTIELPLQVPGLKTVFFEEVTHGAGV